MPDYMFLLESRLTAEQRAALLRVQELAAQQELNIYLTGGAVRDLITGLPIRDLDFTVEGNPVHIARELEKGGAQILSTDEKLRHIELIFHGDVDGSLSAARDEIYERPGARPEFRWSTIMEDLRRRDFTCNAIGLSLNPASRGLLLDPTNGVADLEKREIRVISMHNFTNQPVRLLRLLRYKVRLGFAIEARTQGWFELALERGLADAIDPKQAGDEIRQLAREENPTGILKEWQKWDLLKVVHPKFSRKEPDFAGLAKLSQVREQMAAAGYRELIGNTVEPRLLGPVVFFLYKRFSPRERNSSLSRLGFRAPELNRIAHLEKEAAAIVKMLSGRKTARPLDAFQFLEKVPLAMLAFIQVRFKKPAVHAKIRNYLYKWRPLRALLPVGELESLGVPRGPKFDKILEEFFEAQLRGKGKTPEERTKLLRKLAGIKPERKKTKKEERKSAKARKPAKPGPPAESSAPPDTSSATPGVATDSPVPPTESGVRPEQTAPKSEAAQSKQRMLRAALQAHRAKRGKDRPTDKTKQKKQPKNRKRR